MYKTIFAICSEQNYSGQRFCLCPAGYDDNNNNTKATEYLPGYYETNDIWDFKNNIGSVRQGCYHSFGPNDTCNITAR